MEATTRVLKLYRVDDTSGTLTFDMVGKIRPGTWTSVSVDEPVWDTFSLIVSGSDSAVRTELGNLEQLIHEARQYASNRLKSDPVWLQWASGGETPKQVVVTDATYQIQSDGIAGPLLGDSGMSVSVGAAYAQVALQHGPYVEDTHDDDGNIFINIAAEGGTAMIPSDSTGTAPGRIFQFNAFNDQSGTISQLWCGIRERYNGYAGFISLWEAEKGTPGTDTAGSAVVGTSGGTVMATSFATAATMAKRLAVRWDQIGSTLDPNIYDDIAGKYLVLCRCKVNASTTQVLMQLRHGWSARSGMEEAVGSVYIDGQTGWKLVELGQVTIPPTGQDHENPTVLWSYCLNLYAERLSIAGSLMVDCFILIPSEHMMTVNGAVLTTVGGSANSLVAWTTPGGNQYVLEADGSDPSYGNVEFGFTNWELPVGGGMMVIAGQGTVHDMVNLQRFDLAINIYPRWRMYR